MNAQANLCWFFLLLWVKRMKEISCDFLFVSLCFFNHMLVVYRYTYTQTYAHKHSRTCSHRTSSFSTNTIIQLTLIHTHIRWPNLSKVCVKLVHSFATATLIVHTQHTSVAKRYTLNRQLKFEWKNYFLYLLCKFFL